MLSKPLSVLALGIVCALAACAPKEIFQSSWQPTPIKADGIANEWEIPLRYYDNETKLNYNITNDKENLYLCFRITDEENQKKVLRAGLQLWIDTAGTKKQQIGVLFPLPNRDMGLDMGRQGKRSAQNQPDQGQESKPEMSHNRKKLLSSATELQLWGFKPPIGGITPISNTNGIKAGINWDSSGVMIYELTLPLKTFYHSTFSSSDSAKTFGFNAIINGLPAPKHDASSDDSGGGRRGGGGMGGGGGGMSGGGMGGGMGGGGRGMGGGRGGGMRGGGNSNAQSGLYEAKSFWVKFHLAGK